MAVNVCQDRIAISKKTHMDLKIAAAKEEMPMHKFLQKLLDDWKVMKETV